MMNVAEYIVESLRAWHVSRVYGVIGDANFELLDALARQTDITYIACKHECSAALMASAEAKLTGRIGVCMATSGPGAANLINGLADASIDHAGVFAITGQVETSKIGTGVKQYVNQQALLTPVASMSELVAHPDALPDLLQTCLTQSYALGKVTHLSIPKDLYVQEVLVESVRFAAHLRQPLYAAEDAVRSLALRLNGANKPVLLIGGGARGIGDGLVKLAELLGAAVVTTMPARSLFPNDHPLYLGGLGMAGSEAATDLIAESDLIAMLGGTWWPDDFTPPQAPVAQIDIARERIGIGHPLEHGLVGDVRDIVPQLIAQASKMPRSRVDWAHRIEQARAAWKERIDAEAADDTEPPMPQKAMKLLSEFAAEDAVIAVDTGDHTLWFNRIFQTKKQQHILLSGRWRTLGFAVPAAIAAKLEHPNRQAIAIVGDGGAVQTIMEFLTAVQYKLPIIVIVMNNGSYAMERNRMQAGGLKTLGSDTFNPDYVRLAEACGGIGLKAETSEQLALNLQRVIGLQLPVLIEVLTQSPVVPHTKM